MINWFGRTYYKGAINRNKIFRRSVYRAFRMWLEHDIIDNLLDAHYRQDSLGNWNKKAYWWNCRESHWVFKKENILK